VHVPDVMGLTATDGPGMGHEHGAKSPGRSGAVLATDDANGVAPDKACYRALAAMPGMPRDLSDQCVLVEFGPWVVAPVHVPRDA
jgi:hypothetical protein